MRTVVCRICGNSFESKHSNASLCSDDCRKENIRQKDREEYARSKAGIKAILINCAKCGKEIRKLGTTKYCPECGMIARLEQGKKARYNKKLREAAMDQEFPKFAPVRDTQSRQTEKRNCLHFDDCLTKAANRKGYRDLDCLPCAECSNYSPGTISVRQFQGSLIPSVLSARIGY